MRTRASAFGHLCKGPREEQAALSACEWSLPTAGACLFDVVDVLVCDFYLQESKSNALRQSPVKHTGRGCTALPSPTTSNLRSSASIPGLPPVCVISIYLSLRSNMHTITVL